MTDLSRLPPEFKDAIVKAALAYTNARHTKAAPGHYKALREACHYAREYMAIELPADRIEAELTAAVQKIIKRRAA